MPGKDIAWDLSEIFPSVSDPSVQKAINSLGRKAQGFAKKYQGKIKTFSPKQLLSCMKDYEDFQADLGDVSLFASLAFSANMTLPETQTLHDKVDKA